VVATTATSSKTGTLPFRTDPPSTSLPTIREILFRPLPHLHDRRALRWTIRLVLLAFRSRIRAVYGAERLASLSGAVVFAANHNQRLEAVILPALLTFLGRGRNVHFLADWNFIVIPVLGWILSLNEPIVVVRKDLRPRWLNFMRRWFDDVPPPMERAALLLRQHSRVGIFPEGTAHRDRNRMLRGLGGAARLSLECGATVVPVGLRFRSGPGLGPIRDLESFEVHIGEPLTPPDLPSPNRRDLLAWNARILGTISTLCGKAWSPENPRTRTDDEPTP
jgi:1-acyl-sn-glycerol-3-phosphate acyltransferase